MRYFPRVVYPTNAPASLYDASFEKLGDALTFLESQRSDFNSLQRQLAGRFIIICKLFQRDMLAADRNPDALRALLEIPVLGETRGIGAPEGGHKLIDDICRGLCEDLERIASTVQSELLGRVVGRLEAIGAEHKEGTPDYEAVDVIASSMRCLAHQIAALLEAQPNALRRYQIIHEHEIEKANAAGSAKKGVTAEEFMRGVKPPVRPPTTRERLAPYIQHLEQLRESGYSYALCARFLAENGITIHPAQVRDQLIDTRNREPVDHPRVT